MQALGFLTGSSTEPATLVYKIDDKQPVELLDLTASLMAIGEQFKKFVRQHGSDVAEDDIRLYIKEVRSGSIIAELVSIAQQYGMIGPDVGWVVQYAEYLSEAYSYFKGEAVAQEPSFDKQDHDRLSQIVDPVAKDSGAQLNIVANSGVINVNLTLGSTEANAIQNRIRRAQDRLPDRMTGVHPDQVLYWYQVRDDSADKPGDRAVIPRIYSKPVKVQFASEAVKTATIDRPENPFRLLYIVDVDITEIDGKPVLYKVLEVKDTMERETA